TMQSFFWHVPVKMSLGFLCLFLVCNTGNDNGLVLKTENCFFFLSLFLCFTASCIRRENKKEKQVAVLATAELPAKAVDLAAINLTELVNGMLNTALRGTKKLFSLLSITSYSSFAFHKVSVTIYNISNVKNVDPGKFPMHYCYCLNNVTNDLTDFTALLVDIIGNSTSYLTEIFKSTSILSVRQSNDSDCIYICVMTGQTGRNLSDFWEMLEKSPVVNYTFSSNTSSDLDLDSIFSSFMKLREDPNKTADPPAEHVWTFKSEQVLSDLNLSTRIPLALKGEEIPATRFPQWPKTVGLKGSGLSSVHLDASRPRGTAGPSPTAGGNLAPSPALQPSPSEYGMITAARNGHSSACDSNVVISNRQEQNSTGEAVAPDWVLAKKNKPKTNRMDNFFSEQAKIDHFSSSYLSVFIKPLQSFLGCPQAILKESRVTSPPVTLIVQKINPCVMELCRFFQLCLCVGQRRYSKKEAMRYCVEYYSWFLKNASYVCERVKRLAYSHTLKQKCLKNICTSV
ncbi:HHLA1 protein, partial [Pedionomus torquatus]|nr:HHLA1 protein [Pedionomus torquatus]